MKPLTVLISAALLLVLVVVARQGHLPGLPGPGSNSESAPAAGKGSDPHLRIEIRESAAQAERHYQQIRQRFADDRDAAAWVASCVADAPVSQSTTQAPQLADTWTRACWAAYARQHDSDPGE